MLEQSQQVVDLCLAQGFALAGVAVANESAFKQEFEEWIKQGKQGEMEWMERNVGVRLDPKQLLVDAKSVICVADRYGDIEEPNMPLGHGKIARYARGQDYHKGMKKRLHIVCDELKKKYPEETFKACVDTAPILEREFAARAGLGAIGKHTLLLEQSVGSWMLLGVIVTTKELMASDLEVVDPCASCTRCIDACPTDAITPWELDARKCISYLTIEHRTRIDPEFHEGIGDWMFGCDICQEVCPHNQPTAKAEQAEVHPSYKATHSSLDIMDVLQWDEEARRKAFQGSSMKRAKLEMMQRNALIVAGNFLKKNESPEMYALVAQMASEGPKSLVQQTAKDVLQRLMLL